jgi:hypothetical protein
MFVIRTPDPGRKSIAQGESNRATSATVKGVPEPDAPWAVVEVELPQAERRTASAACIKRRVISTVPSA